MLFHAGRDYPLAIQFLRSYLALSNTVEEAPVFKAHYLLGELLENKATARPRPKNIAVRSPWLTPSAQPRTA